MPLDSTTSITIAGVQCWDAGTEENFSRTKRLQRTRPLARLPLGRPRPADQRRPLPRRDARRRRRSRHRRIQRTPSPIRSRALKLLLEQVQCRGIAGQSGLSNVSLTAAQTEPAFRSSPTNTPRSRSSIPRRIIPPRIPAACRSTFLALNHFPPAAPAVAFSYESDSPTGDDPNDVPPEDAPPLRAHGRHAGGERART